MMRDGKFEFYMIEFRSADNKRWNSYDVGHPFAASGHDEQWRDVFEERSRQWQISGFRSFGSIEIAMKALKLCREFGNPEWKFRIAKWKYSFERRPLIIEVTEMIS